MEAQCYTSDMDTSPSQVIADCGDNVLGVSHHGTAVAQAVMDMVPSVTLYVSGAGGQMGPPSPTPIPPQGQSYVAPKKGEGETPPNPPVE